MPDVLVKLYSLPPAGPHIERLQQKGIAIRRALAPERHIVADWVTKTFGAPNWGSECEVAFSRSPVSCMLALEGREIVGFYCYEATLKGFAGPAGVAESHRRQGIFKALTLVVMHAMAAEGYGYAVLGRVNPNSLAATRSVVDAEIIPGSDPGIYEGMLRSR